MACILWVLPPSPPRVTVYTLPRTQGVAKRCRLSWLTNSPNAGGGGIVAGSQPMSTAVHRSPNKLWRSNSIFNPCSDPMGDSLSRGETLLFPSGSHCSLLQLIRVAAIPSATYATVSNSSLEESSSQETRFPLSREESLAPPQESCYIPSPLPGESIHPPPPPILSSVHYP